MISLDTKLNHFWQEKKRTVFPLFILILKFIAFLILLLLYFRIHYFKNLLFIIVSPHHYSIGFLYSTFLFGKRNLLKLFLMTSLFCLCKLERIKRKEGQIGENAEAMSGGKGGKGNPSQSCRKYSTFFGVNLQPGSLVLITKS